MRIELANTDLVDAFAGEVALILDVLGHPEALVTDESKVKDFFPVNDPVLAGAILGRLVDEFGVEASKDTYIWELARRIHQKGAAREDDNDERCH